MKLVESLFDKLPVLGKLVASVAGKYSREQTADACHCMQCAYTGNYCMFMTPPRQSCVAGYPGPCGGCC